jgi:hypothetical protein
MAVVAVGAMVALVVQSRRWMIKRKGVRVTEAPDRFEEQRSPKRK